MRSFLAGTILILFLAGGAFGQATGFVTAIGFQGNYRPDCWTPLLVHLDSTVSNADDYQIQVHQRDLDKDVVVYARTVSLGPQAHQDYWVYFIPQPVKLRDGTTSLPASKEALAKVLLVYLYDKTGKRQIAELPIGFTASNLDRETGAFSTARARKLVLAVSDQSRPQWGDYVKAAGVMDDPEFVPVKARELPESVLGYHAVDTIIWFDANARDVSAGGASAFEAIQEWVRGGGHLVICQPPDQRAKIRPFADQDMLPVVAYDARGEWAIETRTKPDLRPLVDFARRHTAPARMTDGDFWDKAERQRPAWDYARATARPDAVVDAWVDWDPKHPGADRTPYIARRAYGLGAVTWVAQDLGDPGLGRVVIPASRTSPASSVATPGWPHVWDRVCGWRNATRTFGETEAKIFSERQQQEYSSGETGVVDLGESLLKGTEHTARGAWLITLAVFFFIGYWIVAGPGSYLYLAGRKRKGLSWIAFALLAVVATGLTVLVVRLVLRGAAEVKHVSFVRIAPGGAAPDGTPLFATTVNSRFGLYIPRDGYQEVALPAPTAGQVAYVTPLAIHPQHLPDTHGFPDVQQYVVHTDEYRSGNRVAVQVPYRSTLKKLQARWSGQRAEGVTGAARLVPPYTVKDPPPGMPAQRGIIAGKLTNATGRDLRNVYFAFRHEATGGGDDGDASGGEGGGGFVRDLCLFRPNWPNGATIDLDLEYAAAKIIGIGAATPASKTAVKGDLTLYNSFPKYWYDRRQSGGDDEASGFLSALPLMGLYDRVGPSRGDINERFRRIELHRRGGRELNASQLLAAGRLVILAVAEDKGPLPLDLEVDEERVTGEGTTFYEIALPLDRSAMAPTTRPATDPATGPATAPAAATPSVAAAPQS